MLYCNLVKEINDCLWLYFISARVIFIGWNSLAQCIYASNRKIWSCLHQARRTYRNWVLHPKRTIFSEVYSKHFAFDVRKMLKSISGLVLKTYYKTEHQQQNKENGLNHKQSI